MTPQRLLALDIDGTLLDPALLDPVGVEPEVAAVVREAAEAGVHVALVTGRQAHSALAFARAMGLDRGWLSCTMGAVTVRLDPGLDDGHEIVGCTTFDPREIIKRLGGRPDVLIAVDDPGVGYLVNRRWPDGELVDPQLPLWERDVTATPSLLARSGSLSRTELVDLAGVMGFSCTDFTLRDAAWINVTPAGLSKESGVRKIATTVGVDRRHVVAVGDDHADIGMIRWAGLGVAMGQAPDEVRAAADEVAPSVTEGGVVSLVSRLIAGID